MRFLQGVNTASNISNMLGSEATTFTAIQDQQPSRLTNVQQQPGRLTNVQQQQQPGRLTNVQQQQQQQPGRLTNVQQKPQPGRLTNVQQQPIRLTNVQQQMSFGQKGLDMSQKKVLELVEEIRKRAVDSKDIVSVLKDAISDPKLLKPYVDMYNKEPVDIDSETLSDLRSEHFKNILNSIKEKRQLYFKTTRGFLGRFFDILQLMLVPSDENRFRFGSFNKPIKQKAPSKNLQSVSGVTASKPSIFIPEKVPFDVYFENITEHLKSLPIDYDSGLHIPGEFSKDISESTIKQRDSQIPSGTQQGMSNQESGTDANANADTSKATSKKEGLSGVQIGLIALGGVGVLGAAWYFMNKGK